MKLFENQGGFGHFLKFVILTKNYYTTYKSTYLHINSRQNGVNFGVNFFVPNPEFLTVHQRENLYTPINFAFA